MNNQLLPIVAYDFVDPVIGNHTFYWWFMLLAGTYCGLSVVAIGGFRDMWVVPCR